MIQLPKRKRDPKEVAKLCQCRPICKNRRREWEGLLQKTSGELRLERKPVAECIRRVPTKLYPNSPCPLFGRTRHIATKDRNTITKPDVVRICEAPIDDYVDTPYLRYAELAKRLGAWDAVKARCALCTCGACPCSAEGYEPRDADRLSKQHGDMRKFDARIKNNCEPMRIMYDKI